MLQMPRRCMLCLLCCGYIRNHVQVPQSRTCHACLCLQRLHHHGAVSLCAAVCVHVEHTMQRCIPVTLQSSPAELAEPCQYCITTISFDL